MSVHLWNWYAGWSLILAGFVSGALLGLFFHQPGFLGGYDAFPRRLVRLGHIALVALGMLNVLYSLAPELAGMSWRDRAASVSFIVGGVTMPLVCFLTAWRGFFRLAFVIPVAALLVGVALTVLEGRPCGSAYWR